MKRHLPQQGRIYSDRSIYRKARRVILIHGFLLKTVLILWAILAVASPDIASGGLATARSSAGPALAARPLPVPGPGPWTAPVPSPDGRWLAFTKGDYRGIYLLELESGKTIQLSDDPGAGYRFAWAPDSSGLAFRKNAGTSRLAIVFVHTDGTEESASALLPALSTPVFVGSDLVFFRFDEGGPVEMRRGPGARSGSTPVPAVTPDGRLWLGDSRGALKQRGSDPRVFYNPILSPDGGRFVVECLDGHLYMGATGTRELKDLGAGAYPSFVRRGLLFERSSDDGHRLTAGDLYLLDLETDALEPLTATPDLIERRPALTSDGSTIFFEESGRIFEGRLP